MKRKHRIILNRGVWLSLSEKKSVHVDKFWIKILFIDF